MPTRKLGIFGGTFDPPHHGHLIVAVGAFEALGLDRLVFVPAATSPHKTTATGGATPGQRLEMLRAALDGDPRFAVDDLEIRRGGVSFTVDTLRELRNRVPGAELVFLLGIDQFRALHRWRRPDEVADLATLAVFSRGGETPDLSGPYGAVHVPVPRIDISSTGIRRRVGEGRSIRYYVPRAVEEIVERDGLYGG